MCVSVRGLLMLLVAGEAFQGAHALIPQSDKDAIMALYDHWGIKNSAKGACAQEGMSCELDQCSISLAGVDLGGKDVPPVIGNISCLKEFRLEENNLQGELPDGLFSLPKFDTLAIEGNPNFKGRLNFKPWNGKMKVIEIEGAGFSGSLPAAAFTSSIQAFEVEDAGFKGQIPDTICRCTSATEIKLGSNALGGTIPKCIGDLSKVRKFEIAEAMLTGPLPEGIGGMKEIRKLKLEGNKLSGTLPASIGNMTLIEEFNVKENQLTGQVPASIGDMSSLEEINFQRNQFTGTIPDIWSGMPNLRVPLFKGGQGVVDFSKNPYLRGPLPDSLRAIMSQVPTFQVDPWLFDCKPGEKVPDAMAIRKGVTECTSCPAGTFSTMQFTLPTSPGRRLQPPGGPGGGGAPYRCISCIAGRFAATNGSSLCHSCPLGEFAAGVGASNCSVCRKGEVAGERGSTSCKLCEPGKAASEEGSSKCTNCEKGTFAIGAGTIACTNCPGAMTTENINTDDPADCRCPPSLPLRIPPTCPQMSGDTPTSMGDLLLSHSPGACVFPTCTACPAGLKCNWLTDNVVTTQELYMAISSIRSVVPGNAENVPSNNAGNTTSDNAGQGQNQSSGQSQTQTTTSEPASSGQGQQGQGQTTTSEPASSTQGQSQGQGQGNKQGQGQQGQSQTTTSEPASSTQGQGQGNKQGQGQQGQTQTTTSEAASSTQGQSQGQGQGNKQGQGQFQGKGQGGGRRLTSLTSYTEYTVYRCLNVDACPGDVAPDTCENGYSSSSPACAECQDDFYPSGNECKPCDGGGLAVIFTIGVMIAVVVAVVALQYLGNNPVTAKKLRVVTTVMSFGLLIGSFQIFAVFSTMSVAFPPFLSGIFDFSKIFLFDTEVLGTDCLVKRSPVMKYFFRALGPLFLVVIVIVGGILARLVGLAKCERCLKAWTIPKMENTCGTMFQMLLVSLVSLGVEPLRCFEHPDRGDGHEQAKSLRGYPSVFCNSGDWNAMLVIGTVVFTVYVAPFLAAVTYGAYKATAVQGDAFDTKFRFLFSRFRHECWYYGLVVSARACAYSLVPAIVPTNAQVQIIFFQVIALVSLCNSVYFRPWVTPALNFADKVTCCCLSIMIACFPFFDPQENNSTPEGWVAVVIFFNFTVLVGVSAHALITMYMFTALCKRQQDSAKGAYGKAGKMMTDLRDAWKQVASKITETTPEDLWTVLDNMPSDHLHVLRNHLTYIVKETVLSPGAATAGVKPRTSMTYGNKSSDGSVERDKSYVSQEGTWMLKRRSVSTSKI